MRQADNSFSIERHAQEFIRHEGLMADGAGVLVGLSGGADSVALLHILVKLGYRCHAVHCNFHLRGEESNRDERFALDLCHTLHVPCEVVHFDTRGYAAEHRISIEMAARELRYREFERIRHAQGLEVIAVAHHRDDAVETMLLNLIRGAGINGLKGMRAKNGRVVRPLLCATRDEVIAYLDHIGQPYVTDSTNLTDEYARNKVRLNLLPMMQQINPAAKENIFQAASHLAEAAAIYNKVMDEERKRIVTAKKEGGFSISIPTLLEAEEPRATLFEILHPYGFNPAQTADIFRSLSAEAGRMFHAGKYTVLRDRTHLLVQQRKTGESDYGTIYTLPEEGTLTLPDGTLLTVSRITPEEGWQVPKTSDTLCIDADRIDRSLTVRHPREGDRFCPFGMRGTKLLSDFYTDIKLPRTEKPHQWLLCHGDEIVWAIGQRTSERYRLKGKERCVICIKRGCDKTQLCHPEHSEGSLTGTDYEILRVAQNLQVAGRREKQ